MHVIHSPVGRARNLVRVNIGTGDYRRIVSHPHDSYVPNGVTAALLKIAHFAIVSRGTRHPLFCSHRPASTRICFYRAVCVCVSCVLYSPLKEENTQPDAAYTCAQHRSVLATVEEIISLEKKKK